MINVVDADVREVVRLVLEDTLGVNYLIDPGVQGTITVQTTQPVPVEELVPLLDGVLRVNGAALIRAGNLYKVVPIDQALTGGLMPDVRPVPVTGGEGFALQVVPVRFVSALDLAELLEPFSPPSGSVQVDQDRNLLLLAGSPDQLATLNDLVAMFDVDWLSGMSFGMFPLEFADAATLVAELEEIFGPQEGPLTEIVRFVPIERLNSVLVITPQPAYVDRAKLWITRLDRAGDGAEPKIFVYQVQNGRAADLAAVLGEIFEVPTTAVAGPGPLAPGLEPAAIGGSFFEQDEGFDTGSERRTGSTFGRDRSTGSTLGRDRRTGTLGGDRRTGALGRDRRTGAVSGVGRTTVGVGGIASRGLGGTTGTGAPPLTESDVRIIADESTNALVVRASPRDYQKIAEALKDLDVLPLQVLIEATIAEVRLEDSLRYGLQWFFQSGDFSTFLTQATSGAVSPVFPGFTAVLNNGNIRAVLSALEEVTDVNVISSPQLMVLDNQTARLQVGDQVPIAVQSAISVTDADAPIVNSIEQQDTGVILSVTPRVNAGGLVILEIEQEVSDVVQSETQTATEQLTPTISQRRISSVVAVQSGETIALGGLIQDDRDQTRSGVPLLSRIPIIGALFGQRGNTQRRTELLILITPRAVRDPAEARGVTDELRRRIRGVRPLDIRIR
jgi:general secretion pathway protein D